MSIRDFFQKHQKIYFLKLFTGTVNPSWSSFWNRKKCRAG